jgi:aminopeptidase N
VVLTPDGLEDPVRAFRWIAHELAHLWWCRADVRTWEDWLNESLAEYSALLAVRERFGDAAADGLLARKQADMPGLPPVRGLPRDHEQAHAVLYGKGCVLLHELAESVGTETFGRLLRQATETALSSTDEFLELLASLAGREAAGRFGRSLETL